MADIDEIKRDVRATFYISCLLGGLPLLAHLLVASAVALEVLPLKEAIAFGNQNWLGHLIFVSLAVGSSTLMNVTKVETKWSTRLKVNFFHLVAITILLWVSFGTMAVGGVPQSWVAWLGISLFVAAGTICAYNVDMAIAILCSNGGGDHGA